MTALLPFAVIIGCYVAVLFALSALVRPARERLIGLAVELLGEPRTPAERDDIETMIDTCTSSKVGVIALLAAWAVVLETAIGWEPDADPTRAKLHADPRHDDLINLYGVSAAAASPIAALLCVPPVLLSIVIWTVRGRGNLRHVAEAPLVRASASLQPAAC